jgi:hypothetical protein
LVAGFAGNIGGARGALVAEYQLDEELLFEVATRAHPELDQRRRAQVEHDEVCLAAGRERPDRVFEIERLRGAARREVPEERGRERRAAELRDFAGGLHRGEL